MKFVLKSIIRSRVPPDVLALLAGHLVTIQNLMPNDVPKEIVPVLSIVNFQYEKESI